MLMWEKNFVRDLGPEGCAAWVLCQLVIPTGDFRSRAVAWLIPGFLTELARGDD